MSSINNNDDAQLSRIILSIGLCGVVQSACFECSVVVSSIRVIVCCGCYFDEHRGVRASFVCRFIIETDIGTRSAGRVLCLCSENVVLCPSDNLD